MPPKHHPKSHSGKTSFLPTILILAGISIVVSVVFLLKNEPEPTLDLTAEAPEAQLDWYLENELPVFVFFHSTTCKTCTDMMAVVDQVYHEFEDQEGLIDVDVYAAWNEDLLRQARITNIPTQVLSMGRARGNGSVANDLAQLLPLRSTARKPGGGTVQTGPKEGHTTIEEIPEVDPGNGG